MSKPRPIVVTVVSMATYSLFFVCYVMFNDRLSHPSTNGNSKQLPNRMRRKWQAVSSSDTFQVSTTHAFIVRHPQVDRQGLRNIVLRKSHVTWTNHWHDHIIIPCLVSPVRYVWYFGVYVHKSLNRVLVHNFNDSNLSCQNWSRTA